MTTQTVERARWADPLSSHWTVEQFHRALEAGVFRPDANLELIQGKVIERMVQTSLHRSRRMRIGRRLRQTLEPRYYVAEECPVTLSHDGEPVADVVLLIGDEADYETRNPVESDVRLIVEVAVSSEGYDLGEKAGLYAQGGIPEYWVALPNQERIVVHREPTEGEYRSVVSHGPDEAITPLAAPEVSLAVRELLGVREG